jgi:hypothetical protein
MRTIYKYGLTNWITQLSLCDPKFLHVALQGGSPQLWVEIDPDADIQRYRIETIETGTAVPESGEYLGTVPTMAGSYVVHFYAIKL